VSDKPLDLDKYRGMAAQKATDIRTKGCSSNNRKLRLTLDGRKRAPSGK